MMFSFVSLWGKRVDLCLGLQSALRLTSTGPHYSNLSDERQFIGESTFNFADKLNTTAEENIYLRR